MVLIELLQAALIGAVEGVTEFLPISSTAHIRLAEHALGFHDPGQAFAVVIQLGAILAVCVACWPRLRAAAVGLPRRDPVAWRFVGVLALASLPAAVLGLLLEKKLDRYVFGAWETLIIAATLLLGGAAIIIIERLPLRARHHDAGRLPPRLCLGIGLLQVLAMIPGVSRSGASILGAMCLGVDRRAATEFSFFLAMPIMCGASLLKLVKHPEILAPERLPVLAVGLVASFVIALVAVRWLLRWISTNRFTPFGWYRLSLGLLLAVLLATGVIPPGGGDHGPAASVSATETP
jgi:undecaprenyl-diphosphatase